MKAIVCEAFGPPETLVLRDLPEPGPGPGEAAIEVKACALNFPDALTVEGKYQIKPERPFIPGAELAGVVRALGAGVTNLRIGDAVIVATGKAGALCETAIVSAELCAPVPSGLDFVSAAALLVTSTTALYALRDRAHLRAGETVLVLGAGGGVGLAAVQVAKILGARVIAAASSQRKIDLALSHGADASVLYPRPPFDADARKALTESLRVACGGGADVIFDPLGGDYSEAALRVMNWGGRFLVIGFATGEIARVPLNLPLLKSCAILGVFMGAFSRRWPAQGREHAAVVSEWAAQGKLKPHVSAIYPLARTGDAMRVLLKGEAEGKIVITL